LVTTFAFAVSLVALLMSWPVIWHEEHLWNPSVLQRVHLSDLVIFQGGGSLGVDTQEEVGTLHQQPLALGYFVSTAPTGRMPKWFWASCPHLENVCPAFLKNALHLHSPAIQQNSDDLLQQQSAVTVHPLDSQYTTDVLR
jgi:hypothetical protein